MKYKLPKEHCYHATHLDRVGFQPEHIEKLLTEIEYLRKQYGTEGQKALTHVEINICSLLEEILDKLLENDF